ncbi:MAG TPA: glycerophosphodiester phosphodiesterase family protein [Candidatus Saccharimonadales bacterium]
MQIIGHRGACGYEPENTLASFKKALELGVDAIELDVYALQTGELVVIHDDTVDRTTNAQGYVTDYSFEQLRKLDAGKGQMIPTLQEVLNLVDKRVPVNIELKGTGTARPVANVIDQYKQKGWANEQFIVSSFNHVELAAFSSVMPDIRISALIVGIPIDYAAFASKLHAYSANFSSEFITAELVIDAKARGLKVFVFTVNDKREVHRMQALEVDGIFTNYPDKVRAYLLA